MPTTAINASGVKGSPENRLGRATGAEGGLAREVRMGVNRGMPPPFDPSRLTSRRKDELILALS